MRDIRVGSDFVEERPVQTELWRQTFSRADNLFGVHFFPPEDNLRGQNAQKTAEKAALRFRREPHAPFRWSLLRSGFAEIQAVGAGDEKVV